MWPHASRSQRQIMCRPPSEYLRNVIGILFQSILNQSMNRYIANPKFHVSTLEHNTLWVTNKRITSPTPNTNTMSIVYIHTHKHKNIYMCGYIYTWANERLRRRSNSYIFVCSSLPARVCVCVHTILDWKRACVPACECVCVHLPTCENGVANWQINKRKVCISTEIERVCVV